MTPKELLKPRYKVIADYPDNKDFPAGEIIEFEKWESCDDYWCNTKEDCQGKRTRLQSWFEKYPHIFKALQWWEERGDGEPCDFVKNKSGEVFMLHKIVGTRALIENIGVKAHYEYLEILIPASSQDYDNTNPINQ